MPITRIIALTLITLILMLGLTIMLAWHFQWAAIFQIKPGYQPLPYNTALCFLLVGCGLLCMLLKYRLWVAAFGVPLLILAVFTLVEYWFAIDLQIDTLIVDSYLVENASYPGRMSVNTALCFLILAVYFMESVLKLQRDSRYRFHWTVSAWLTMFALMSIIAYTVDTHSVYGWGNLTGMPVLTSLGVLASGITIYLSSFGAKQQHLLANNKIPVLIFLAIVIVISIFNWKVIEHWEYKRIDKLLQTRFELLAESLDKKLNVKLRTLQSLSEKYSIMPAYDAFWELDAEYYFESFDSLTRLLQIGANFEVKRSKQAKASGNRWSEAGKTLAVIEKKPHENTASEVLIEGNHLTMIIPLKEESGTFGYLLADFSINVLLKQTGLFDNFHDISFIKTNNLNYKEEGTPKIWSYAHTFFLGKDEWKLSAVAGEAAITRLDSILPNVMLIFVTTMASVLVWMLLSYCDQVLLRKQVSDLIEAVPAGLIKCDAQGKIILANKAVQNLLGYTECELKKMVVEDILPGIPAFADTGNPDEILMAPSRKKEGIISRQDIMSEHKSGYRSPVEITTNKIQAGGNENFLISIMDISERKQHEKTIKRKNAKLEDINEELSQFAYVASHDLKSPLRAVENLASWIEEDAGDILPEQSRNDLAVLKSRIKRMSGLLDGLLEYSRLGSGSYQSTKIDCKALLVSIIELLNVPSGFVIELIDDMPEVYAPRTPLEIVLRNLIANAIKHHDKEQGLIQVSMKISGAFLRISVADDGPGILPKYHEQIFKIFQTLKPNDEVEGSGIGLSMIKKIVDNYQGEVEVHSNPANGDRGTAFVIMWPLKENPNDAIS